MTTFPNIWLSSDHDHAFSAEERSCSALDCLPINRTTSPERKAMGEMLGIKAEMQGEGQNITLVSGSLRCGTLQCAVFDFLMS